MDYNVAFAISKTGMSLEQLRLEVATQNLAQMNQATRPGASPYRPLRVVSSAQPMGFSNQMGVAAAQYAGVGPAAIVPMDVQPRTVQDPGHPYADQRGLVTYPGVDHAGEMINLMTAVRAYEANVVAFNMTKTMVQRALEIGGNT
jgi:flagellar basal-body rod protein FlgC